MTKIFIFVRGMVPGLFGRTFLELKTKDDEQDQKINLKFSMLTGKRCLVVEKDASFLLVG